MITEHQKLFDQIAEAITAARELSAKGENVQNIERHLTRASDEVKGRIAYYEANQPAAPAEPTDPKSLLMQHSKNELIAMVDDWNTTPGRTSLITLEPNWNKSQIADAILAAQPATEPNP